MKTALNVKGIGDNHWKTITVVLHNPVINQSGILGSDFMLVNRDGIDDIFHGIEVDITRKGTLSINEKGIDLMNSTIFPNPTNSLISWDNKSNADEVIIYNTYGQIVFRRTSLKTNTIDLIDLNRGLYFVELLKGKKRVSLTKLIKD